MLSVGVIYAHNQLWNRISFKIASRKYIDNKINLRTVKLEENMAPEKTNVTGNKQGILCESAERGH